MSRWGILAISAMTGCPAISFPAANASFDPHAEKASDCISSRSITALFVVLGTSIPTAALPGIGASALDIRCRQIQFNVPVRLTILLTLRLVPAEAHSV